MTRFVDSNNAAEAAKRAIRMFVAVDMDFTSGHVRAHDGIGPITWGGFTYDGVGSFGGIEAVNESVDVVARAITITLSGVESGLLSSALTEDYQGRQITVYTGFMNIDTGVLIGTPETAWEGRMNQLSVTASANTASIKLTCEHRLRREPKIARYTDQDQQLLFSGDRFFDLIPSIKGFVAKWGDRDAIWQNAGSPVVDTTLGSPGSGRRFARE